MTEVLEVGSRTRRRPIGRDYAAAKDAEVGKWMKKRLEVGKREEKGSRNISIADLGF